MSEGDWVAEGAGQTCAVRLFDGSGSIFMNNGGRAIIDIYSKERAVFGRQLSATVYRRPEDQVIFGWVDTDKNMFHGKLGADNNELTGLWQGRDFMCGASDHNITFRRTRSSL